MLGAAAFSHMPWLPDVSFDVAEEDVENLSQQEIAKRMNVRLSGTKSRVHRGRDKVTGSKRCVNCSEIVKGTFSIACPSTERLPYDKLKSLCPCS